MIKAERCEVAEVSWSTLPEEVTDLVMEEVSVDGQTSSYVGQSKEVAMSHLLRSAANEMLKYTDISHAYSLWYAWLLD